MTPVREGPAEPARTRMAPWPVLVLAAFGFAACTVEAPAPPGAGARSAAALPAEDSAAVRAELERYYADFTARDWGAFAEHFWPGATIATVWQAPGEEAAKVDAPTVAEFVAKAPQGPGSQPIFEERMTGLELRVHRNLAQAWARYTARFGDSTSVAEWEGIDAFTLLRHDGRWRIMSLAFTDLAAP